MATAKLNREKLKKMMMSQQDEAPLVIGKKKKANSSSKKATDERSLPPPPLVQKPSALEPAPMPSVDVIEIPADVVQGRFLGLEEGQDRGDEGRHWRVR